MGACDEAPNCKSNLAALDSAKHALAGAIQKVNNAKAARLASCGGAGASLLAGGGIIAAAGGPIGWIVGGLIAGAGAALSLDCIGKTSTVRRARTACATDQNSYQAAIQAVKSTCPVECWDFPTMPCP